MFGLEAGRDRGHRPLRNRVRGQSGKSQTLLPLCAVGLIALLVTPGCGSAATSAPSASATTTGTSARGAWTGFGAKLSDWEKAHPKNLTGCPAGTCFGGRVMADGQMTDEFTTLMTTGPPDNRVDGYTQAIGDGTPLAAAKAAVREVLPRDARTSSFSVQHTSTGSCAMWNLRSKTLGRWFSGRRIGDARGDVGVELSTATSGGTSAFQRNNVGDAIVNIGAEEKGINC